MKNKEKILMDSTHFYVKINADFASKENNRRAR